MNTSQNELAKKASFKKFEFCIYSGLLVIAVIVGGCAASSAEALRRKPPIPKGSVMLTQRGVSSSEPRTIKISKNSIAPGALAMASPSGSMLAAQAQPAPQPRTSQLRTSEQRTAPPSSAPESVRTANDPSQDGPGTVAPAEPAALPERSPAPAATSASPTQPARTSQPAADNAAEPGSLVMPSGTEDKRLYSFRAENLDLKSALAVFARANNLNIVPDQDVTGTVTLDVKDLPLKRVLQALLEAHDFTWTEEDGLIRVRATETRMFQVDYLRMSRKGVGASSATLSSGSSNAGGGGGGAGGGGLGGGGGFGGGGGLGGGGGGQGGQGQGGSISGSAVNLTQENPIDFWKELEDELTALLTTNGKDSLAINKTAGMIQITDRPSALKRVDRYLANLGSTVQRQVEIEAKLYDVTLNDQFQFGLDWDHIIKAYGGNFRLIGTPTVISPGGGMQLKENALTAVFNNDNTSVVLTALREQGEVNVISQPRLRTLNNQTALIKVGTDTPFFSQDVFFIPSTFGGASTVVEQVEYQLITIGTILAITPQIASDETVTLDISPVITSLVDTRIGPNNTTAPVIDIKQASSIVRVNDGETIVLGGLIQNSTAKTVRKIPVAGDIPVLGKLFQGKFDSNQKKELVIFLTPRIVKQ